MRLLFGSLLCLSTFAACRTHLYYVEYPGHWPPIDRSDVISREETRALRIAIIGPDEIKGIDYITGPHSIATELALAGYQVSFHNNATKIPTIQQTPDLDLIVTYEHKPDQRVRHEGPHKVPVILSLGLFPVFAAEFDYINVRIFPPGREGKHFVIRYVKDTSYGIIPWIYRPYLYESVYSGCIFVRNFKASSPERSTSDMNIQIANLIVSEGLRIFAKSRDATQESD